MPTPMSTLLSQRGNPFPHGPAGRHARGVTLAKLTRACELSEFGRPGHLGAPSPVTVVDATKTTSGPRWHRRASRPRALKLKSYSRNLSKRFAFATATARLDRLHADANYRARIAAQRAETDARAHRAGRGREAELGVSSPAPTLRWLHAHRTVGAGLRPSQRARARLDAQAKLAFTVAQRDAAQRRLDVLNARVASRRQHGIS